MEKLESPCIAGGNVNGTAAMGNNLVVLQKVKQNYYMILQFPFLGIYLTKLKAGLNQITCIPMFILALFTIAKR